MLTAGERLKQKRLESSLTFTQVSQLTRIPAGTLRALEKNRFHGLPGYPFLKGMIQNYAKVLGLDPVKIVAAFKRDYDQARPDPAAAPPRPIGPGRLESWSETPWLPGLAGAVLFAVLVGWSLWRVYQPPRLAVESPRDGQTAVSPVTVTGLTDRDASLTLNGETVNLEPDGRFRLEYPADPGKLQLVFRAASRRQKVNEQTINLTVID